MPWVQSQFGSELFSMVSPLHIGASVLCESNHSKGLTTRF